MSSIESTSIIIPVSRNDEILQRCLESLKTLYEPPTEVLIVGSRKPEVLMQGLNITFIECVERSPSIRRNLGVRNAKGDIFCFIDDDVQVTPGWLSGIVSILSKNPDEIIGGPNRDFRKDFRFRYPSAIQANILTEGILSRKKMSTTKRSVGIHDLPLCNVAMRKHVFEKVGGFNEYIPYFLDDVEFNFIAENQDIHLMLYDKLEVGHDIRPAWWPYLKYKFLTRWEIGKIMPIYSCLYTKSFQIKLVFATYLLIPILFIDYRIFGFAVFIYLFVLCASALPFRKDIPVFLLLPAGVFATQCLMYTGFTAGIIWGYMNYLKLRRLIPQKEKRFARFETKLCKEDK